VWSLFYAYHGFYSLRLTKAALLVVGGKSLARGMWEDNGERKIVAETAPDHLPAFDLNPALGGIAFLEHVEKLLLTELRLVLAGDHSAPKAQEQAARLIATVNTVIASANIQLAKMPTAPINLRVSG
jgi:hypothetical protein